MRRRIVVIAMLLLAGAIVNVAVAWGSIFFKADTAASYCKFGEPDVRTRWYGGVRKSLWKTFVWRSPTWISESVFFSDKAGEPVEMSGLSKPLWSRIRSPVNPKLKLASQGFAELEEARGWPLRSMVGYTQWKIDLSKGGWVPHGHSWNFKLGQDQWPRGPARILPMRPLFIGFFVNAVAYGAIMYGVMAFFRTVVRVRRRKRHLCPACAYPIGTSPVCTECGEVLQHGSC